MKYTIEGGMSKIREEDAELKIIGWKKTSRGRIPIVERGGMPQGLSISPVLCTLLLEAMKAPKNLHMYADDGIYLGCETDKKFRF